MRELSVAEQRYRAVLAVISDGRTVKETAAAVGVSRQTLHAWLAKYEVGGLEGLGTGRIGRGAVRIRCRRWSRRRCWRRGGRIRRGVRGGSR